MITFCIFKNCLIYVADIFLFSASKSFLVERSKLCGSALSDGSPCSWMLGHCCSQWIIGLNWWLLGNPEQCPQAVCFTSPPSQLKWSVNLLSDSSSGRTSSLVHVEHQEGAAMWPTWPTATSHVTLRVCFGGRGLSSVTLVSNRTRCV